MNELIVISFTIILYVALLGLICALLILYVRNAQKVLMVVQGKSSFSLMTVVRTVGIFFPLLGIVMGIIKGV